jgi:hypothetical protein
VGGNKGIHFHGVADRGDGGVDVSKMAVGEVVRGEWLPEGRACGIPSTRNGTREDAECRQEFRNQSQRSHILKL